MANSQILLIVLGIVIVGISVAVGITHFRNGEMQARRDRIVEESMRIAARAALWKGESSVHGGGRGTYGLSDLTLEKLNLPEEGSDTNGFTELSGGYYRLMDLDTAQPYIQGETREGDLVVRVFVLGREHHCFIAQWSETYTDFPPAPAVPPLCTGW